MIEKFQNQFHESWLPILTPLIEDARFVNILQTLVGCEFEPEINNIFRAFKETTRDEVRLCILGMDPYNQKGIATGIAFGNSLDKEGISPSLSIILEELESIEEFNEWLFFDKLDLLHWCHRGILMLNSALTVEVGKAGSHQEVWHYFMKEVLKSLDCPIYLLGKEAQKFKNVNKSIYCYPHPAADTYGDKKLFRGSGIFKQINKTINLL